MHVAVNHQMFVMADLKLIFCRAQHLLNAAELLKVTI